MMKVNEMAILSNKMPKNLSANLVGRHHKEFKEESSYYPVIYINNSQSQFFI